MSTQQKTPINLSDLSPDQIKELAKQAQQLEKESRQKVIENREAYKKLVEETVPNALCKLIEVSENLSQAKKQTFEYFEKIIILKNEAFGIKEKQRSHTFSYDGGEITIGYRINDGWDDTVHAGVEKVLAFINSLSKDDETAALVQMVFNLLKKDDKGNLKSSRVLELQKMTEKFNNDDFTDGVDIISKAFKPVRSSWYIEAYKIHEGKKTNIALNMASVDFPEGYSFDFFKPDDKIESND